MINKPTPYLNFPDPRIINAPFQFFVFFNISPVPIDKQFNTPTPSKIKNEKR